MALAARLTTQQSFVFRFLSCPESWRTFTGFFFLHCLCHRELQMLCIIARGISPHMCPSRLPGCLLRYHGTKYSGFIQPAHFSLFRGRLNDRRMIRISGCSLKVIASAWRYCVLVTMLMELWHISTRHRFVQVLGGKRPTERDLLLAESAPRESWMCAYTFRDLGISLTLCIQSGLHRNVEGPGRYANCLGHRH